MHEMMAESIIDDIFQMMYACMVTWTSLHHDSVTSYDGYYTQFFLPMQYESWSSKHHNQGRKVPLKDTSL